MKVRAPQKRAVTAVCPIFAPLFLRGNFLLQAFKYKALYDIKLAG